VRRSPPPVLTLFLSRFLPRFVRAQRGATAVEFALVSVPLLVLTFGMLELAMVFMVGTTLDSATEAASRKIRTGEFQTSAAHANTDFKALVCGNMSWLTAQCPAAVSIDVRTFANFSTLAGAHPLPAATFDPTKVCFSTGQPTDIVLVRAYFQWNLFTPLLNNALENMGGGSGKRLLSSTTAFRNEPYNNNNPVGTSC
jgi:Flp pilus assembly protein TadG